MLNKTIIFAVFSYKTHNNENRNRWFTWAGQYQLRPRT